jgi:alkylation response protein AidB-like acyl-CoA dehydrogenase
MDFELSEEQELLRAGLRQLLERECDISRVRAVAYDGDGRDPELWRALADAGWLAIAVPEAEGGAGLKFEDVVLVIAEAGRALAPVPLTTTLLAARSVARSVGSPTRGALLPKIADGSISVTLALDATPQRATAAAIAAARDGNAWRLSGSCAFVPYGPSADVTFVAASMPSGGQGLFIVSTSEQGVRWDEIDVIDRTTRQYEMTLDGVRVDEDASLFGEEASAEIDRLRDEWRASLAAESFGAAERLLELTVAYAKERVQFGRPIGANQAVKARVADMGAAVEQMRAAVYYAAVKIDAGAEDRAVAVALAKMTAASAGTFVGTQAIHVHGGVGYTWEHDAHLYFKRIKSNELLLGDAPAHLARIAEAVLS